MAMAVGFTVMMILFSYLVPMGLLGILQYVLSKMESPWPGRVLPILAGAQALLVALFFLFNAIYLVHGDWSVVLILGSLILLNIPTVLYIVIYRRTRRNLITKKNMEKMSIQDLE